MIFTLNILIDLLLIFAIWKNKSKTIYACTTKIVADDKQLKGKLDRVYIVAKIAEKTADRAFNMASSANLGVVALQKALAVPRLMTKQQGNQNNLAKTQVDELFNVGGTMDWLRPLLTDEQLDILDKAESFQQQRKEETVINSNGRNRS